jgi:hypothetical protein
MQWRTLIAMLAAAGAVFAAGCGGGSSMSASEPKVNVRIKVVHASFPLLQAISKPTHLVLQVRNTSLKTAPNVAVTIDSFNYANNFPENAATQRPIWVIEHGPGAIPLRPARTQSVSPPGGGQTNYVNTWALGPLGPGQVRSFSWYVVPVKSGLYTVHYAVTAGLAGNAKAVSATGGPVHGAFIVHIAPAPPPSQVNPNTGRVVPGSYPGTP